ncbi:MAG TPA: hypothetical protein VK540_14305 [Polyangiaceae bacterium]|nr:hypothetical protein [Polyangiaceae bacterium]
MSIALANSVGSFFHEAIGEAVRSRQVEATEQAMSYLVALLSDFAHPDEERDDNFDRPLAFLLDEALRTTGAQRFQRLRTLGDSVLYITGFFGDHIENRGVDVGYVTSVGATAYRGVASMLRRPPADTPDAASGKRQDTDDNVFTELSQKFDRFVDVLTTVADATIAQQARGERGVVMLYERWLRSGSATLAKELGARGIIPHRGSGGVH